MGIEVEFISKELIKPSSPTPHHLSKIQFSSIDQNQIPVSMPFVLFYEKSNIFSNQERCNLLKTSLSKALTIFYPLAGRINNYSYVDCNDEGALFIEAKTNCKLSDILRNRNQYHNYTKKFIPLQPHKDIHQFGSLFQITYFHCGGLAVSFAMPHMLGDGSSQFIFLNGWAAVASGNITHLDIPPFGSSSIFPPKNISGFNISQSILKEKLVTKHFVFDACTISALGDKYSVNGKKLTRVRALSVFILSRIMATLPHETEDGHNNRCMVTNAVNMRQLLDPPLSKQSFGNFAWIAGTVIDTGKEDEIARKIRELFTSLNAEAIKKFQNGKLNFDKETFMESLRRKIVKYSFTSLCNFPAYEVDFGWGKPEWIAANGMIFDNLIIFMDRKDGKGIEAWISLTELDMDKFEIDEQLVSHISTSPNENQNLNSRL